MPINKFVEAMSKFCGSSCKTNIDEGGFVCNQITGQSSCIFHVHYVAVHAIPAFVKVILCTTKLLARVPASFKDILWQFVQNQHLCGWFCM